MCIITAWNQEIIKQMKSLDTLDQEDVLALITMATHKLTEGTHEDKARFDRITKRYGWEDSQIEVATITLAKVLVETSKSNLSERQFIASVRGSGLNQANLRLLKQVYADYHKKIRKVVSRPLRLQIPRFVGFQWRLDLEIETRFMRRQMRPILTLRTTTKLPGGKDQPINFNLPSTSTSLMDSASCKADNYQCDYTMLVKLQNELEAALRNAESIHCLRIKKYM